MPETLTAASAPAERPCAAVVVMVTVFPVREAEAIWKFTLFSGAVVCAVVQIKVRSEPGLSVTEATFPTA